MNARSVGVSTDEKVLRPLPGRALLLWANFIMIAVILIHDADHIRQARLWCYAIERSVWIVNLAVYLPSTLGISLALLRHKSAAPITCINGLLVAVEFAKVHLWRPTFPIWGIWNRNFFLLGADRISWSILAATVLVGVGVAMTGAYVGGLQSQKLGD